MKKTAILSLLPWLALAGQIVIDATFSPNQLAFARVNGFDVVTLDGHGTIITPGQPMLPEATMNIVVPPSATVTNIHVEPIDQVELDGRYLIHPGQQPVTISSRSLPVFVPPDPTTYSSTSSWPNDLLAWDGYTGQKSGYRLVGFAVRPLTYLPASGKLILNQRMRVVVTYTENTFTPHAFTRSQNEVSGHDVRRIVANPADVARFAPPTRQTDNLDCDYAIITSTALMSNWTTLADWRTKKGWYTRVFSVDTIAATYPGRDRQEKIRNFIIDYWLNHGLKYVLLAGDHSVIPSRRGRVTVSGSTGNIPADAYYGDLQWSWDGNNNNIFGEMTDTVDLYYDVLVGRASVDNSTQVATFINKTLLYEKNPTTDYLQKMLLPYVNLFPDNNYSGRVVSESIANHTPAGWIDTYIADPTTTAPIRDAINQGYNFVHGAAHGDDYGWYTYYGQTIYSTNVANSQTNATRPSIINSIACIAGNFEAEDCLAEALMNNPNGGAVAVMMNSREGWGTPPAMGPSELMDFKFYKYLLDEDSSVIGSTHAHSKDYYAYSARSQDVWRWCYYDLNLFGDPDMQLWDSTPTQLTVASADTIPTGTQNFQVTVTRGGSPVYNALVCCYKPGELHEIARTGWNGVASLTINPATTGTMYLTTSVQGSLAHEKTVTIRTGTAQPFITVQSYTIDDGGNGQLDPGETADILVTLRNLGNLAATNVQALLRTASSFITLVDSTATYGNISAGDSLRADRFRVTAAAGTPPGTSILFTVHVTATEGNWDPTFTTTVGVPPVPGRVTMDHDTGYCKLTVTAIGSIGFTEPPAHDPGSGFCYPKTGPSSLYFGSFMFGNSPTYLVDRFYGQPASSAPPNNDFRIIDSLRPYYPAASDQHYRCIMSDAGHSTPQGIRVTINSHQLAASGYDDFVVLRYDLTNTGTNSLSGIYAGIIADFDVGTASDTNTVTSNETKRYIYMRHANVVNPCVGLKILAPASFANLCAVDHARYVYPDSAITDGMKYRILNGTINQRNSNRAYDWSAAVSVGPFDLAPGGTYRCAFAVIGASSPTNFDANADSAQSWYDNYLAVTENEGPTSPRSVANVICSPNPFQRSVEISLHVSSPGPVSATVFDVTGRSIARIVEGEFAAGPLRASWNPAGLPGGVYLLKVSLPSQEYSTKLLLLR